MRRLHCFSCLERRQARRRARREIAETIAVAIEMSGGPGTVYGAKALAAFDELNLETK